MEERVIIAAGEIVLEGRLTPGDPVRAGLVCHPHSLYGGSMDNNVVQAAVQALVKAGWTALRFNFRGVGRSAGVYGDGLGEQEDAAAAVNFLKERGAKDIVVIGYSFGAWVSAFAWPRLRGAGLRPLVLIAPPAAFMSFEKLPLETEVGLIICGEEDEIAPPDLARELGSRLAAPVEPVVRPRADHFFAGHEPELISILSRHLDGLALEPGR
ncbi:MAG: alpha/beta fold hydrolase [Thermodesulfobacteriota bacterium]